MAFNGLTAEIPLGISGFTGTRHGVLVRPDHLLQANNVSYADGSLGKEGGAAKYNTTPITGSPKIVGGVDWFPMADVQRMIVATSTGSILRDDGAGSFSTVLAASLGTTSMPVFVEGGSETAARDRRLFCFLGSAGIRVVIGDATVATPMVNPSVDWAMNTQPTFGCLHEGRLWTGLGHRMYYSLATDHEDFRSAGAGQLSLYPGEGERLVGALSFKGLLICWKYPRGIYVIDTSNIDPVNWRILRLTTGVGAVSPLGQTIIDDDIVFIDASGNIQLLSGIQEFGDLSSRNLSQIADLGSWIRDNLAVNLLSQTQAIYYPLRREAHFAVPGKLSSVNNLRLVIDFNRSDLPRFRISDRDTPISLWVRRDTVGIQRPVYGDNAGTVWLMDQAERSKAGVGYEARFQTPHLDLGYVDPQLVHHRKDGKFLELVYEPKGNWDLTIEVYWDGIKRQTIPFNMESPTGAILGSWLLGTDPLGGAEVVTRRHRLVGSGHRFGLIGKNSGAAQDFALVKALLHFASSDERA